MIKSIVKSSVIIAVIVIFCSAINAGEITENFEKYPLKGRITLIDLGAKKCIPCKMMAPILMKLDKDYKGVANIFFIDVWKHREQAKRFNLRAIPTQIFFDANGKEVLRHVGFMDEKSLKKQLEKMGAVLP